MRILVYTMFVSSVLTGCMTEADKALWAETKETFSSQEKVADSDKPAVAPEVASAKTAESSKDSVKDEKDKAEAGADKAVEPAAEKVETNVSR